MGSGDANAKCPVNHGSEAAKPVHADGGEKCPVNHGSAAASPPAECPMHVPGGAKPASHPPASADGAEKCPVMHTSAPPDVKTRDKGVVYNVYAQPIDPKNQMPVTANQNPSPGQNKALSTSRQQSTIPKGGTDSTWLYPSPQMFWNALVRKNKADGVLEDDMDMVVSIHNEMNERAWKQVAKWEMSFHNGEHLDGEPSLRRFMGKPYELSPKARLKSYLGYGFPFDRHDWYVDRNGKEVRYIIDYYFNGSPNATVENTIGKVREGDVPIKYTSTIHVDVRPAVDDAMSAWDRLKLFPQRAWDAIQRPRFRGDGLDPSKAPKEAAAFALHSSAALPPAEASKSAAPAAAAPSNGAPAAAPAKDPMFDLIDSKCRPKLEALMSAADDDARGKAHIDFTFCMGTVVCPEETKAFREMLEKAEATQTGGAKEEKAFQGLHKCVAEKLLEKRARISGGFHGVAPAAADKPLQ